MGFVSVTRTGVCPSATVFQSKYHSNIAPYSFFHLSPTLKYSHLTASLNNTLKNRHFPVVLQYRNNAKVVDCKITKINKPCGVHVYMYFDCIRLTSVRFSRVSAFSN